MRADLISRLSGVQVRPSAFGNVQRNIGVASNQVGEAEETGGGVLTKVEIPDPFGLRVKYANNPGVINCLDTIWQAVQEFNLQDGKKPLNLGNADLRALGNIVDKENCLVNLERYILGLSAKRQYPLDGAILDGARLDGARLDGAILVGARLDGARLDGARLDGARLDGAILVGARLDGAILVGARLDGARLDGAILTRADLRGAYAYVQGQRLTGEGLKSYLSKEFPDVKNLDSAVFV